MKNNIKWGNQVRVAIINNEEEDEEVKKIIASKSFPALEFFHKIERIDYYKITYLPHIFIITKDGKISASSHPKY